MGLDETPAATHLPWFLSDPISSRRFQSVKEAFDSFQGNLLLLGAPGSGKTTTLLHIRRRLLDEAENDPDAPVPLLVNLSQFRIKIDPPKRRLMDRLLGRSPEPEEPEPEERKRRLKCWLIDELARWPGVTSEIACRWFEEKRVAVLMDGLDEVGASYRADLVRLLNEAYLTPLKDYPDAVVVVCSRINEYLSLQDNPLQDDETQLQLRGAVTLQPLTREQIESYLDAAQATGLREALPNDADLYKIAQTPLTLSMMVLAYGGLAPEDIPAQLSLTERRYHLMEAYVVRMLQRKERRDHGRPFRASDVPERDYRYRPDLVNRFLNWLAARLSVRMQTGVSMGHFHEFLTRSLGQEREESVGWCVGIARSVFMFLGILILGTTLMPASPKGFLWVTGIGLVLMSLECAHSASIFARFPGLCNIGSVLMSLGGAGSAYAVTELASILFGFVVLLGTPALFIASLGVASRAIAAVVPSGASPYTWGIIATCAVAMLLSVIWVLSIGANDLVMAVGTVNEGVEKRKRLRMLLSLVALDATSPIITFAATHLLGRPDLTALALAAMLVATLVVEGVFCVAIISGDAGDFIYVMIFTIVLTALLGCQLVGTWVVGSLDWYEALAVIASLAFVLYALEERLCLFTGLVLIATLGGAIGGGVYAVLGTVLFLVLAAVIAIASADVKAIKELIDKVTGFAEERIRRVAERFVLTPVVLCVIALTHGFPLRWARFLDYTTEALLLKRSGPTTNYVEFMHRLLRDYFALRNLQPLRSAKDRERWLDAIRKLGFLGDSAIDSLAELARDPDPLVREVAISAVSTVGMISVPGAVRILEEALADREPLVRRALVLSLRELAEALGMSFLGQPGDPRVIELLIQALRDPEEGVRAQAAEALGHLAKPLVIEPLTEALADQEMSVRLAAATALNSAPLSLFRQLQSGDEVRTTSLQRD